MDLASKIASEITIFSKYARFLPKEGRRETWDEIVDRYEGLLIKKYPKQEKEIVNSCKFIRRKEVLPSMRFLQFAGKAITLGNSRGYNCSYMAASYNQFFKELMFLLLGGSGVGYSVQKRHIEQLPKIKTPGEATRYVIGDSIIGWSDAVGALFNAFFKGGPLPQFDYDDIRPKGTPLKTAGGKAPGPGPLRICLDRLLAILENKEEGSQLTSVEISDCACFIADAVLSGGIRRAAMIALFDIDDVYMLHYKTGAWYELNGQRGRVNVSAVAHRQYTTKEQFLGLWKACEDSRAGEPGIFWTNDYDLGLNPCAEISLRHKEFCNLTTVNFSSVRNQHDFFNRIHAAAYLGTLQAGFTDFHYLTKGWKDNCREEALLGVSITGLADGHNSFIADFEKAARLALDTNEKTAQEIGINKAARVTCIKPEGTSSLVLGTASGIHARHSEFYIRRFRFKKNEVLAQFLQANNPEIIVEDQMDPDGVILELPQKSPEGSITREEPVAHILDRNSYFHTNWVRPGHRSGANEHNVSTTISVRDYEWELVGDWMWVNRFNYNAISVLPFDGGSYVQAPFEAINQQEYERRLELVKEIDLTQIHETEDGTSARESIACAGGSCEIP